MAVSSSPATLTHGPLRPCQQAYLGESNARRMLKRAQLSKKAADDDPIFALHEEHAAHEALTAAATPFDLRPSSAGSSSPTAPRTKRTATGYSVQCYATRLEDEHRRKDTEAAEEEMMVLFHSVNSSRRVEGVLPLALKPSLCTSAQEQADTLYAEEDVIPAYLTYSPTGPSSSPGSTSTNYVPHVTVSTLRSGRRRATLVSPPRLGALACGELWYGGKYRRHLYAVRSVDAETGEQLHGVNCPCHLRMVFETMVDAGWHCVGVGLGRGSDGTGGGRWVLELGE